LKIIHIRMINDLQDRVNIEINWTVILTLKRKIDDDDEGVPIVLVILKRAMAALIIR